MNISTQQQDYGICNFCGAKKVKSPKTQKIFCSEKCWLKKEENTGNTSGTDSNSYAGGFKKAIPSTDSNVLLMDELMAFRREFNERMDNLGRYFANKDKGLMVDNGEI